MLVILRMLKVLYALPGVGLLLLMAIRMLRDLRAFLVLLVLVLLAFVASINVWSAFWVKRLTGLLSTTPYLDHESGEARLSAAEIAPRLHRDCAEVAPKFHRDRTEIAPRSQAPPVALGIAHVAWRLAEDALMEQDGSQMAGLDPEETLAIGARLLVR